MDKEKHEKKKNKLTLQSVVEKGDVEALEELLRTSEKGNDLGEPINTMQTTLIHLAAEKGATHKVILQMLVRHRVLRCGHLDMVATGDYTALHYAVRNGCLESVEILLENGAFVSAKDKFGNTPLHIAVDNSNVDMVKLLLTYGAGTQIKNKDKKIPMSLAKLRVLSYAKRDDSTLNQLQLDSKEKCVSVMAVFEETTKNRTTEPKNNLFYASSTGNCELIRTILSQSPHIVNTISNSGHGALYLAVKNEHSEALETLLELGANPKVQNDFGTTPLHKAIETKNLNCFATLMAHGAPVHLRNREGKIPIDLATASNQWDFVAALVERHIEDATEAGYFVPSVVTKMNHVLRQATREGEVAIVQTLLRTPYAVNVNENTGSGWTGLHLAIKHQQLELVIFFLKNKADVNAVLAEGFTALHMAAELPIEDRLKVPYITVLLRAGANPNAVTLAGYTALHMLVKKGQTACVRELLEEGSKNYGGAEAVDPNIPHPYHSVPYYMAIKKGNYEVAELLIRHGSRINTDNYPLLHAIRCGHTGIATEMVGQGMNVNVELPPFGWTPLGLAVLKEADLGLVRKLIDAGAEINKANSVGFTPLHSACSVENEKVVELLLERKANPNIANEKGFSPLHTALTLKNASIVRLLLRGGADTTLPFPKSGTLPAAVIAKLDNTELIGQFLQCNSSSDTELTIQFFTAIRSGQTNMVKYLVEEKGLDINNDYHDSTYNDQRRPLGYTIKKNNSVDMEMIKYLISLGANPSLPMSSSSSRSLLHLAIDMKHQELFNYLLTLSGINVNMQEKNKWTPLGVALGTKNEEFAFKLIKARADVNVPNDKMVLPIHQAVSLDNYNLVEAIIKAGADVNVITFNRMTPLDFALREKRWNIAKLLLSNGANRLKRQVGRSSWTLMHFIASLRGVDPFVTEEVLRIMIKNPNEFPINQVDINGWTPVHLAVRNFNKYAVDVLIKAGADITIQTKNNWAPLHTLGKLKVKKFVPGRKNARGKPDILSEHVHHICNVLIDSLKGMPHEQGIDQPGENGYTPLDIAIFNQNEVVLEKLRENGAVSCKHDAQFGVHQAAEADNVMLLEALLSDKPESLNKTRGNNKWTPLHVAAWFGSDKATAVLVAKGADVFAVDKDGRTALHLAVHKRRRRVVKALMATPKAVELANAKDKQGRSVLDNEIKYERSVMAAIDRKVNKSYKTTTEERVCRGASRRTRQVQRVQRIQEARAVAREGRGRRGGGRRMVVDDNPLDMFSEAEQEPLPERSRLTERDRGLERGRGRGRGLERGLERGRGRELERGRGLLLERGRGRGLGLGLGLGLERGRGLGLGRGRGIGLERGRGLGLGLGLERGRGRWLGRWNRSWE